MLEDLLKVEAARFQEETLAYAATTKLSVSGNFPEVPHVLQYQANGGTPSRREVVLRAIRSSGGKLLAERRVTFHYATIEQGREAVYYSGQELRTEDVAALKEAIDELIELSKGSRRD